MPETPSPVFTPPGPGPWDLESVHTTRPSTRLTMETMPALSEGFRETMARYGALIDTLEYGYSHGVGYTRVLPVGAKNPAAKPPPKRLFQVIVRVHPEMRRRRRAADTAVKTKLWLSDLRRWDEEVKPATIARHRELLAVDPAALSNEELVGYIDQCADWSWRMVKQHHQFNGAAMLPAGRLFAAAARWTGLGTGELACLFAGASPISAGWTPETERLVEALENDPEARAKTASSEPPEAILAWLRARPGPAGEAASCYLDLVGTRIVTGYTPADRSANETPHLLLDSIRRALTREPWVDEARLREDTARIRALVPEAERATFDTLLDEARRTYRLRDERGLYSDSVGSGIARRALLAVGDRLAASGRIHDRLHALEAGKQEIGAMLRGAAEPSADELAARFTYRTTTLVTSAPAHLGPPSPPPPPLEWLPAGGLRTVMESMMAVMAGIFEGAAKGPPEARLLARGKGASAGSYEGTARLIMTEGDFDRIEQGDVLVTTSTSPAFNIVLPRVGAIVTDHGGVLSHAAIVSREFGIPSVVGCGDATASITDGTRICVDGGAGVVTLSG